MLSSVAGIEQTATDGYKGVIKVTIGSRLAIRGDVVNQMQGCLRLQKTITVAVHGIDSLVIGDTDMVGLDANEFS